MCDAHFFFSSEALFCADAGRGRASFSPPMAWPSPGICTVLHLPAVWLCPHASPQVCLDGAVDASPVRASVSVLFLLFYVCLRFLLLCLRVIGPGDGGDSGCRAERGHAWGRPDHVHPSGAATFLTS